MDPSKSNDNEKKFTSDKERDEDAANAIMEILSLNRSVPMSNIQELVQRILSSKQYAHILPVLICYLRNHNKSLAPGAGSGERDLAERLTVALYEADRPAGLMVLRFLVAYGSWKSLLNILVLCDQLCNAESEATKQPLLLPSTAKGGDIAGASSGRARRRRDSRDGNEDRRQQHHPRQSAAAHGPHKDLCKHIHELFAKQLIQDREAVDAVANAPGEVPAVSNAAKFAPHEHRARQLTSAHADAIASHLFPDEKSNLNHRRKCYRQLRSRLNEANRHLPDRYLAMGRADELEVHNITAGYLAKNRKALLNIPDSRNKDDDGPERKKMRYDDPARIDLRERLLRAAVDPRRVPVPSDLAELANGLLDISNKEEIVDDAEQTLLESSYLKAVLVLSQRVKERREEVSRLVKALSAPDELNLDVSATPSDVIVAVDVSPSQSHTFPIVALLVLLFNDALDALAEDDEVHKDESDEEEKPAARRCILFHQSTQIVPLPSSRSAPVNERLAILVKRFRSAKLTVAGKDDNDYAELMQALNQEVADKPNATIVVCSDFTSSPEFAAAIEQHLSSGHELCCWRMTKPSRQREREVAWNPEKPQIDLCIALDTTGSMGSYIEHCKSQIESLLQKVSEGSGMPVACSFVSYKDFGNPGHLDVYPWTDAQNPRLVTGLRRFIGDLGPSGGDDAEEDIAGAFEKVRELMLERANIPSLKIVLLIADCGAHGYPGGRPNHRGMDQKERLRTAVRQLASSPRNGGLGCELMLAKITSHTDLTCEAIDQWLQSERTFIDQIEMGHASATVFRDKVLASVEHLVSHAIAPPTAKGLDVVGGTDFSICDALMNTRLANYAAKLAERMSVDTDELLEPVAEDDDLETMTDAADDERGELPTALGNLMGKLESEDYNMVRQAMGTLTEGVYAQYEPPAEQHLSQASVNALLQAGLTVEDLRAGGYPEHIIDVFVKGVKDQMTRGAGKKD